MFKLWVECCASCYHDVEVFVLLDYSVCLCCLVSMWRIKSRARCNITLLLMLWGEGGIFSLVSVVYEYLYIYLTHCKHLSLTMFQCLVLSQTCVRFRIIFVLSNWTHTQSGYEIHSWSATEKDTTILLKSVFEEALLWSVLSLLVLFLHSAVLGENVGFIRHVSQRSNHCCEVCFLSLFCFCTWLLLGKILISLDMQQLLRMCERALTVQDQFMIKY